MSGVKVYGIFLMREENEDGDQEFAIADVDAVCQFAVESVESMISNLSTKNLGWFTTQWPKTSKFGKTLKSTDDHEAKLVAISDDLQLLKDLLNKHEDCGGEDEDEIFKNFKKLPIRYKESLANNRTRVPSKKYPLPGEVSQKEDQMEDNKKKRKAASKGAAPSPKKATSDAMMLKLKANLLTRNSETDKSCKVTHKDESKKAKATEVQDDIPIDISESESSLPSDDEAGPLMMDKKKKDQYGCSPFILNTKIYNKQLKEENELLEMRLRVKSEECHHLRALLESLKTDAGRQNTNSVPVGRFQPKEPVAPECQPVDDYSCLDAHNFSKFASELSLQLFGPQVMATANITGTSSHAAKSDVKKEKLDVKILNIVIAETIKKFPTVTAVMVKNSVRTKCQNLAASLKKQLKRDTMNSEKEEQQEKEDEEK